MDDNPYQPPQSADLATPPLPESQRGAWFNNPFHAWTLALVVALLLLVALAALGWIGRSPQ